ncbi:hypothetical protein GMMP1_1420007 [Candidatus Magnetomoraceae bacterium gMMP-1]
MIVEQEEINVKNEETKQEDAQETLTNQRQIESWEKSEFSGMNKKTLIKLGAGIFLMLVVLFLFLKTDNKKEYVSVIKFKKLGARLNQLEERLVWLEEQRIDAFQYKNELDQAKRIVSQSQNPVKIETKQPEAIPTKKNASSGKAEIQCGNNIPLS